MKHQIQYHAGQKWPYRCTVCLRTWRSTPNDTCVNKPCYYWQQSPSHLQTFSQLRRASLKPRSRKEVDGYLWCHDEWFALYDQREATPRRHMTEKQRQAYLEAWPRTRQKYTCAFCGGVPRTLVDLKRYTPGCCRWCLERLRDYYEREADRSHVVSEAQKILAQPEKYGVLDCETTSLSGEPVEIAVVDLAGKVLFNSLIKPTYPVEPGARAIHGITDTALATAPTPAEVWRVLQQALQGRTTILTYNADFDEGMVAGTARRDGLDPLPHTWRCLMKMYAAWFGAWSDYHKSYQWQPLEGGHRALGDALAALDVLRAMAKESDNEPSPEERLRMEWGRTVPSSALKESE